MMGSFFTRCLVMILGYAYPAYECFKTVERNKPEIEQLRFWCQYWILVATLTVLERVGDTFISWLPMYGEAKLAFFIYLWYPKTKGTHYVYQTFLRPYVAKHETEIDRTLLDLRVRAGNMAVLYWERAASYGQTRFFEILQYVASQSSSSRATQTSLQRQEQSNPPNVRPPRVASATREPQPQQASSRHAGSYAVNSQEGPIQKSPPLSPQATALVQCKQPPSQPQPPVSSPQAQPPKAPTASGISGSPEPPTRAAVPPCQINAEKTTKEMELAVINNERNSPTTEDVIMEDAIRITLGRLRRVRAGKQNGA